MMVLSVLLTVSLPWPFNISLPWPFKSVEETIVDERNFEVCTVKCQEVRTRLLPWNHKRREYVHLRMGDDGPYWNVIIIGSEGDIDHFTLNENGGRSDSEDPAD